MIKVTIGRGILILLLGLFALVPVAAQDDGSAIDSDGDNVIIDTDQAAEQIIQITESTAQGIAGTLNTFISQLINITQNQVVMVAMLIIGALLLVAGWRIYNWIIVLVGALVGGTLAVAALGAFVTEPTLVLELFAFAIGALLGGGLGYFVYYGAVFIAGAYFGIVITTLIAQSLGLLPISPIVILVAALVGGVIMLALSFELLVILASLMGAQLIVLSLGLTPATLWLIGLALVGMFIQITLAKRSGRSIRRRPSRQLFD